MLDLVIKGAVRLETWHLVDLNQRRLQLVVYHDVEAQDLEAKTVLDVVWLARTVKMVDVGLR